MSSLGIDIGGANIKVATHNSYEIIYHPIWRYRERLKDVLVKISEKYKPERVGVVITAELSDAFKNKDEGIQFVTSLCKRVFRDVYFLDLNGKLHKEIKNPRDFAASNWVASVRFLLTEGYRNFLFVDIGSTTTDIIPVSDDIEAGKTDFERLKRGELLYFGILRTPVFYILKEFEKAPLCPEYFAITADVFLVTGDISEEDYICDTPDGKGKSYEDCLRRLARTVCCDLEELGLEKAKEIAFEAKESMKDILSKAISKKLKKGMKVFACGIGEFLVEEVCECVKLSDLYGDYSKLFPAYAMLRLVEEI